MSGDLIRRLTPEEEELESKQAELATLEEVVVQSELALTVLYAELNAFEQKYQQNISIRFAELDRIEAQIEEYTAYLESLKEFKPSDSLKKLYREVAKRIHPDLATDEAEKLKRQELMIEANQAYENGDEEHLKIILHKWESSPESVRGEGIGAELVRVLRQIAQGHDRLQAIEEELLAVQQSKLYQLRGQVVEVEKMGRDLLEEMAAELDEQITTAQQILEEIKIGLKLNN